jgi:hypothetical protein
MSSTTANLVSSIYLLEFMAIAPESTWSNDLVGSRLLTTENCSIIRDLDIHSKYIESVSSRARVNKWEEFTDIVLVSHDINRTDII